MIQANLLAEICSLLICLFIIYFNDDNKDSEYLSFKLFRAMSNILLFNIAINLVRYLIPNIKIQYISTLLFHSTNALLYFVGILYCISLTRDRLDKFYKYNSVFSKIYFLFIIIILSSPFTKLVYYIDNGVIERGPVAFISFLGGYFALFFIIILTLCNKKASIKIKKDILNFSMCLAIPSVLELYYPNNVIHGFGYICALLIIYNSFNNNRYDLFLGVSKEDALNSKFNRLKKKNKNFSLILLNLNNLEVLSREFSTNNLDKKISQLFRNCEELSCKPSIYRFNNHFFILTEDIDNTKDLVEYLNEQLVDINLSMVNKLSYNIFYMTTPFMVSNLSDLKFLKENENLIQFISEKEIRDINYNISLVNELKDIFNLNDLSDPRVQVFYQPILDIKSNKFLSAEALSRLDIKELGGLVFPDKFIPMLEDYNFIHKYSLIVLNKVCCFIKQLEQSNIDFEGISVNFSLKELMEPSFEQDILEIVDNNKVNPNKIHIELTESIDAKDFQLIKSKITNLKNCGFKFYLDDFGTGYSNLSKIMEIPFDVIKFDKSLIDKSMVSEYDKTLTFGMANLFSQKFEILFEGIETKDYENFSYKIKINYFQGYYYSRPIKSNDLLKFLGKKKDEIVGG